MLIVIKIITITITITNIITNVLVCATWLFLYQLCEEVVN